MKGKKMATMALPIRELSANVQYETAYAQKVFWNVAEGVKARKFQIVLRFKTHILTTAMSKLIVGQQDLISALQSADVNSYPADVCEKLASDISRLVNSTTAFVADASDVPSQCLQAWSGKLDVIYANAQHLDSIAESLYMAADPECKALLALAAEQVAVR